MEESEEYLRKVLQEMTLEAAKIKAKKEAHKAQMREYYRRRLQDPAFKKAESERKLAYHNHRYKVDDEYRRKILEQNERARLRRKNNSCSIKYSENGDSKLPDVPDQEYRPGGSEDDAVKV
jgi:hypothetical protein